MTPLKWPESYKPAEVKRYLGIFAHRRLENWAQVKLAIRAQLLQRPQPDTYRWGRDDCRVVVGQTLCELAQSIYGWPNDHFVPEDPIDIVFLMPDDDLEIAEVILQFEERFNIRLPNIDEKLQNCKLLGEMIETLATASGCQ